MTKRGERVTKRYVVDLSYTHGNVYLGALTGMIKQAVVTAFADDDDIEVVKVGHINNVLGIEKAKKRKPQ